MTAVEVLSNWSEDELQVEPVLVSLRRYALTARDIQGIVDQVVGACGRQAAAAQAMAKKNTKLPPLRLFNNFSIGTEVLQSLNSDDQQYADALASRVDRHTLPLLLAIERQQHLAAVAAEIDALRALLVSRKRADVVAE